MLIGQDNHVLMVNKPPGVLCQGDRTGDASLEDMALAWLTSQPNPTKYVGLIHRLDRPASGSVVIARTSKAAQRLAKAFRERAVEKMYFVVVEATSMTPLVGASKWLVDALAAPADSKARAGCMLVRKIVHADSTGGTGLQPLIREAEARLQKDGDGSQWKLAALRYEVVWKGEGLCLLAVALHTGRRHQIRAQLSAAGHSLVGDTKYGSKKDTPVTRVLGSGYTSMHVSPCHLAICQHTFNLSQDHSAARRVS
jgi:23S rRNA-/tRNA-specific pseudouridylate synthase